MTQYTNTPHASAKNYEHAFEGLQFPVAIHQILRRAADTGGLDHEVQEILHELPRDQYESEADLRGDIHAIYAARGFPEDAIPV